MTSLWMGNLEPYMDERFISSAFATMGEHVAGVRVIRNKITGEPAGYCFVELKTEAAVERCLRKINGKPLPGATPPRRFKLNWATYGKRDFSQSFSLFVGDLTSVVDDGMLYEFFLNRYPSCQGGKVLLDSYGNSRGCGFVQFPSQRDQKRALLECQGARGLGSKPLRLSLATNKAKSSSSDSILETGSYGYGDGSDYDYNYMYRFCTLEQYQQSYSNYYPSWAYDFSPDTYSYSFDQSYSTQNSSETFEEAEEDLEDPSIEVDVEGANQQFMERSEELYDALMDCHWQQLDDYHGDACTDVYDASEWAYMCDM